MPKHHPTQCAAPDCTHPAECAGYCNRHYNQRFFRNTSNGLAEGTPCPICYERCRNLSGHMTFHHHIPPKQWYAEHNVTCREDGCDNPVHAKGYCYKHYLRRRRAAKRMPRD